MSSPCAWSPDPLPYPSSNQCSGRCSSFGGVLQCLHKGIFLSAIVLQELLSVGNAWWLPSRLAHGAVPASMPFPFVFQCNLACHKKCLESLAIQCGHKKLQGKLQLFGQDFTKASQSSADGIPFIIKKCITEIEKRALKTKVTNSLFPFLLSCFPLEPPSLAMENTGLQVPRRQEPGKSQLINLAQTLSLETLSLASLFPMTVTSRMASERDFQPRKERVGGRSSHANIKGNISPCFSPAFLPFAGHLPS